MSLGDTTYCDVSEVVESFCSQRYSSPTRYHSAGIKAGQGRVRTALSLSQYGRPYHG
jgi:hypothetical protein